MRAGRSNFMNMNDLKHRDLRMPDDMTAQLEDLVKKEVGYLPEYDKKKENGKITYLNASSGASGLTVRGTGKRSRRTFLVFGLAAALACGGIVSAAVIKGMQAQKKGNYGQEITFYPETSDGTEAASDTMVTCSFNYLPDGVTYEFFSGKAEFTKDGKNMDLSAILFSLDPSQAASVLERDVDDSEKIDADGHDGLYLSQTSLDTGSALQTTAAQTEAEQPEADNVPFRQTVYVYYPEVHAAMQLYAGSSIPKDEVLKIAQNTHIAKAQDGEEGITLMSQDLVLSDETEVEETAEGDAAATEAAVISGRKPGDQSSVETIANDADGNDLNAPVTLDTVLSNVKVYDDLSAVPESDRSSDQFGVVNPLSTLLGDNGKLKADTISYVKYGDGINTKNTVVSTDQVPLKFVTVDLTYTNNTGMDLTNILFYAEAYYRNADGSDYIAPKESDGSWDGTKRSLSYSESYSEMAWESVADTFGQNNGSNYIDSIKAGESRTVTIGFLADEDQLSHMIVVVGGEGNESEGSYSLGLS